MLWSVAAGGPVSGAAVVVAGVAYAGSTWGRITGVDAKSGRVVLSFPHGEYVRSPATAAVRLRTATRASGRSSRSMRKWIAALAALILLAGGAVVGYVVYKREEAADVRGSSTEEFVTTEEEEPPRLRRRTRSASPGR